MADTVLIAGGGVAGLEAALALRELAGDRVTTTVLTPEETFEVKALSVREPFALPRAHRHSLADVARDVGFELRRGTLASVDPDRRVVVDTDGGEHSYDHLIVAVGARWDRAIPHAVTFTGPGDDGVHGVLEDMEGGYAKRIAFVAPSASTWPLPLYELALLTAERAASVGLDDVQITVVTPEDAPLALFGHQASTAVAGLLRERGIEVLTSAIVEPSSRVPALGLGPGHDRVPVDRVVALPVMTGRSIPGLPADAAGFVPIDGHARVLRDGGPVDRVYAAGDGTSFPIKQGGIAAQQADAAAEAIAAAVGADVTQHGFHPVLRGILLTDTGPRWLRANVGADEHRSELAEHALWWPPTKVAGHHLGPYLWEREENEPLRVPHEGGVGVDRSVDEHALPHPRRRLALSADGPEGHLELLELPPE